MKARNRTSKNLKTSISPEIEEQKVFQLRGRKSNINIKSEPNEPKVLNIKKAGSKPTSKYTNN